MQTDERIIIQHIVMGKLDPQRKKWSQILILDRKKNHIRFKTWTWDTNILKSLKTEKKLCNSSRGDSFMDMTPRTEATKPATLSWEGGRQNGFCTTNEKQTAWPNRKKRKTLLSQTTDKELNYKMSNEMLQFSGLKKWLQNGTMTPKDSFPETRYLQPTCTWEATLRTLRNCK